MPKIPGSPAPHDALFRLVFSVPGNAASLLRGVLPDGLAGRLDLDALVPVPASLVDESLGWRHSDLLFTAVLDGRPAFVLVEHQSSGDARMALRVLRYAVRAWDTFEREHPHASGLPPVIAVVVHTGARPWTGPVALAGLVDLGAAGAAAAGQWLPRLAFVLDDLACAGGSPEQALRARPLTAASLAALLLLRAADTRSGLAADLRRWAPELAAVLAGPAGEQMLAAVARYVVMVGEVPPDELRELFAGLGPKAEEIYMTTAEILEARGLARSLVQLLTQKFGPLPENRREQVDSASVGDLETWTGRVLDAATLGDVFR